jgi:hypothetical protein
MEREFFVVAVSTGAVVFVGMVAAAWVLVRWLVRHGYHIRWPWHKPPSLSHPPQPTPVTEAPPEPPPPASGWCAALTIPTGVYMFLLFALTVGGSLGGSFLMYSLSDWVEAIMPGFGTWGVFAGGWLGFIMPPLIFLFVVPVRCPECSGPAVYRRNQGVPTFRCKSCGHVHRF